MASISQKTSSVPGKKPLPADIQRGELAVNLADKKIFTKDQTDQIIELGGGLSITDNKAAGGAKTLGAVTGVQFAADGTYFVPLTGGTGTGGSAKVVVAGGNATATVYTPGSGYAVGDMLTIPAAAMGKYSTAGTIGVTAIKDVLPVNDDGEVVAPTSTAGEYQIAEAGPQHFPVLNGSPQANDVFAIVRGGKLYQLPVGSFMAEIAELARAIANGESPQSGLLPPAYDEVVLIVEPDATTFVADLSGGYQTAPIGDAAMVDWGDGTVSPVASFVACTHTYADAKRRTVKLLIKRGATVHTGSAIFGPSVVEMVSVPEPLIFHTVPGVNTEVIGRRWRGNVIGMGGMTNGPFPKLRKIEGWFAGRLLLASIVAPSLREVGWLDGAAPSCDGMFSGSSVQLIDWNAPWFQKAANWGSALGSAKLRAVPAFFAFPEMENIHMIFSEAGNLRGSMYLYATKATEARRCFDMTGFSVITLEAPNLASISDANGFATRCPNLEEFTLIAPKLTILHGVLFRESPLKRLTIDYQGNTDPRATPFPFDLANAFTIDANTFESLRVTTIPPGGFNEFRATSAYPKLTTIDGDPFALATGTPTIELNGAALTIATCRHLLESLAKAVTAGTCTGGTISLSGGTSASIVGDTTAQASVAILQGGGVTVTAN